MKGLSSYIAWAGVALALTACSRPRERGTDAPRATEASAQTSTHAEKPPTAAPSASASAELSLNRRQAVAGTRFSLLVPEGYLNIFKNAAPYFSSLAGPTPETCKSSASFFGLRAAISSKVASLKIK